MIQTKSSELLSKDDLIIFASEHLKCAPRKVRMTLKQLQYGSVSNVTLKGMYFALSVHYTYEVDDGVQSEFVLMLNDENVYYGRCIDNALNYKSGLFDINRFCDKIIFYQVDEPISLLYYEFTVV